MKIPYLVSLLAWWKNEKASVSMWLHWPRSWCWRHTGPCTTELQHHCLFSMYKPSLQSQLHDQNMTPPQRAPANSINNAAETDKNIYKPEEKHVQTEHSMQHQATKSTSGKTGAGNRGFGGKKKKFSEITWDGCILWSLSSKMHTFTHTRGKGSRKQPYD